MHVESALVDQPVMVPAQQHEVVERRLAAVRPVFDVVAVEKRTMRAAGKTAAAVPRAQGSPDNGWNGPGLAADGQRLAVLICDKPHDRGIAGDTSGCFRGNVGSVV